MVEVYAELLSTVPLPAISDVCFSYFRPVETCGGAASMERFRQADGSPSAVGNTPVIWFSNRDPAGKLAGLDAGKLLVAMFAWDGNSYTGKSAVVHFPGI